MDPSLGKKKNWVQEPERNERDNKDEQKKEKKWKWQKRKKKKKKTLPCKDMFVQNTKITLVFPFSLHISL